MSADVGVWIYFEHKNGEIEDAVLDLVNQGRKLADKLGEELSIVAFGTHAGESADVLARYGAATLYFINNPSDLGNSIEVYEEQLHDFFAGRQPRIILFSASLFVNDLASRLAARMKTGLVTDCIGLALDENDLLVRTKLTHGGKIASTIVSPFSRPEMATIKPGFLEKGNPDLTRKGRVELVRQSRRQISTSLKSMGIAKADPEKIGLDEAEVIVAGGRGMGSAENLELLKGLAESLGGVVAASLGAVDEEFAPRKILVGQTGTTVAPRLYVACGISGSIYHVLGMKDSEAIVVINKDRSAPFFKYSDMGMMGDAMKVIPVMIKEISKLKTNRVGSNDGEHSAR